jgi:hypothetical protein
MDVMDGQSGSDSDVEEPCMKTQLISVKEEPPDASDSESSDEELELEPFTCIDIKKEVEVSCTFLYWGQKYITRRGTK